MLPSSERALGSKLQRIDRSRWTHSASGPLSRRVIKPITFVFSQNLSQSTILRDNLKNTVSKKSHLISIGASENSINLEVVSDPAVAAVANEFKRKKHRKKPTHSEGKEVSVSELLSALGGLEQQSESKKENSKLNPQSNADELALLFAFDENSEDPEKAPNTSGNPLGRKVLGKEASAWLNESLIIFSKKLLEDDLNGNLKPASHTELIASVKNHLLSTQMPSGAESKCQLALDHYSTIWDNLQRSMREVLVLAEKEGKISVWKESASWKMLKGLSKTVNHRSLTRASANRTANGQTQLSDWLKSATQAKIDEFVPKALELLKLEREEEVNSFQRQFTLSETKSEEQGSTDAVPAGKEDNVTLRGLTAVSMTPGLRGSTLVTLRPSKRTKIPLGALEPGESIIIRTETVKKGSEQMGTLRGLVHSLGEDGASLVVGIDWKYGKYLPRIWGAVLSVERGGNMADETTYKRTCEALQKLQTFGLQSQNPSLQIVSTLFMPSDLNESEEATKLEPSLASTLNPTSQQSSKIPTVIPSEFLDPETVKNSNDDVTKPSPKPELSARISRWQNPNKILAVNTATSWKFPVTVVQGPPGTGKTNVLRDVILKAVRSDFKVLAVAPTNAAVDNLVEKLTKRGIKCVRIGNPARLASGVADVSLDNMVEKMVGRFREEASRRKTDLRSDLKQVAGDQSMEKGIREVLKQIQSSVRKKEREAMNLVMKEAQVVLCTLIGAGDPVVEKYGPYDLAVVDEAGQATEPASWIPLLLAKRAVLAGDTCQLAPTIMSRDAVKGGLGVSLMERAVKVLNDNPGLNATTPKGEIISPVVMLNVQYRMNAVIASWCSSEMYEGKLNSSPLVKDRRLLDNHDVKSTWQTRHPMVVLDTRMPRGALMSGCEERKDQSGSFLNEGEADIVCTHVTSLIAAGVSPKSIAVQSPYLAQVQLLQSRLEDVPGGYLVEVASVDAFQGREAEAVVISMVRSNPTGTVGFVSDRRRMNVAISRAKSHVAVVCDSATVGQNVFIRRLLQHIRRNGVWKNVSELNANDDEFANLRRVVGELAKNN